jgi:hypothetical protein
MLRAAFLRPLAEWLAMVNEKGTGTSPSPALSRGWRIIDAQQFRTPPEWLAGIVYAVALLALLAAVFVAIVLLGRVVLAVGSGAADDINKLLIGLADIVGAPFVVWRVIIAANQAAVARESHFTTLFTKAVEQLGATREVKETDKVNGENGGVKLETATKTVPNLEVRLGAIYALERITRDSERDHWPIMEVLCAYVRNPENTGAPVEKPEWNTRPGKKRTSGIGHLHFRASIFKPRLGLSLADQKLALWPSKEQDYF